MYVFKRKIRLCIWFIFNFDHKMLYSDASNCIQIRKGVRWIFQDQKFNSAKYMKSLVQLWLRNRHRFLSFELEMWWTDIPILTCTQKGRPSGMCYIQHQFGAGWSRTTGKGTFFPYPMLCTSHPYGVTCTAEFTGANLSSPLHGSRSLEFSWSRS